MPHPGWEGVRRCRDFGKTSVQGLSIVVLVFMPKVVAALCFGALWISGMNPVNITDPRKPLSLPSACCEETCLNLNVETPAVNDKVEEGEKGSANNEGGKEKTKLPVMVWIHGGAFQLGAISQYLYQPIESFLACKGVVLVTINYRLGALGFLKVQSGDHNCGMWDQVQALKWVQENIAAFVAIQTM